MKKIEKSMLKFTLLEKIIFALQEARAQGTKQYHKIKDQIEFLLISEGFSIHISTQYIVEAEKRLK